MTKHTIAKTLILAGIVTLSTASVKANAPTTGIYVGAALGGTALTGTSDVGVTAVGPTNFNYRSRISDKNVGGDIFLGYGKRVSCAWFAIEALASITSLTSRDSQDQTRPNANQTITIKTTNAWGGAVNLGYFVNAATKLYLKLGIESRTIRNNFNNPDLTAPTLLSLNKSNRSTAFVPGLGMETDLNARFSVRAEYRTALHPRKTSTVSATTPGPTQSVTTIRTKPTVHYFNLGLTFRI